MELLAQIPIIGGPLAVVLPFLLVLSIIVFVHEFGHYIVGRWCGIRAEVFSIGFGKPLWSRIDRRGTRWQVAMLPLGGYVKFVGDMDPASAGRADDADLPPEQRAAAFHNARLLPRVLTVCAGPVANFLLTIVIFSLMALWIGLPSEEPVVGTLGLEASEDVGLEPGDRVLSIAGQEIASFNAMLDLLHKVDGHPQPAVVERDGQQQAITLLYHRVPRIYGVSPGTPAARAGLLPGDIFVSLDGEPVNTYYDLQVLTAARTHGAEVVIEVDREGERLTYRLVPEMQSRSHPVTGEITLVPTMGISGSATAGIEPLRAPMPIHRAVATGALKTWDLISGTMIYISDMVFKDADRSQLGGPIRIAKLSGDAAKSGFSGFFWMIAVLSTSIGLLNLFPIPILDGGHLMFYAVEWLRGRPVGEAWMRIGTMVGLSLVLLLMVFATYNDLVWLF